MTKTTENEPKLENETKTAQENKEVQQEDSKPKVFSKQDKDEKLTPEKVKKTSKGEKNAGTDEERKVEAELSETEKKIAELESKLTDAQKQLLDAKDMHLRLQADFDNYRKRNAQLRTDSLAEGQTIVISKLLNLLDSFERALDTECSDSSYASGMQMIYKMLTDTLNDMGLEVIDTSIKFDPAFHEAVMQEEAEGKESGAITLVLRKGYMLNGKVIRPAMVKVAK